MKKSVIIVTVALVMLALTGCQKVSKIDFEQVLDMNISLENDVLQKSNSNILTLTVENTSGEKIILPKSSFLLEFTSYSGNIQKTFYIDPSEDIISTEVLAQNGLEIYANDVLSGEIDLGRALFSTPTGEKIALPSGDYTINLIINMNPDLHIAKSNEILRSNYADVQVKG